MTSNDTLYNMNKVSRNIKLTMTLAMLLCGSVAQAQVNVGGKVFGGGNEANVQGSCSVTINQTGAVIAQDVHGGGALAMVNVTETPGENPGDPSTFSPTSNTTTSVTLTKGTVTGNIYGGGLGDNTPSSEVAADVYGPVTVTVNGGSVINVFGCNNLYGAPQSTVVVDIEKTESSMAVTNVYGGGNLAAYTGGPVVNIKNGTVSGSVFGGGYGATAVVTGAPHVTVGDLTQDGYQAIVNTDVYGGGDAANVITGTPVVLIQKCNTEIHRDVYGGGNAADVPATSVTVTGGTISGSVFGGGHGDKDATPTPLQANVADNTSVTINGGTINKVFGGSNSNGTIGGTINVFVEKTGTCDMHITEIYGGGNFAASNAGNITVNCTGTFTDWDHYEGIEYLYGGANQADVTGPITLNITKGTIKNVFGGNNTSGTISGNITVNVTKADDCMHLYNVYGAGNVAAYTGSPAVNINHGTVDNNVYGGGKGADAIVTGNPAVTIGDATAEHVAVVGGDVYGGGDAAAVTGATTVNYNDNNASSTVGKLFGGGNAAGVSSTATVTLTSGKVVSGIYGGCNSEGNVEGKITVNVTGGTVGSATNLAASYTTADVYGGGYGADTETSGDVEVNINGADVHIYGDVYGGSALGDVNDGDTDKTTVNILNGTLHSEVETITGGFKVYHGGNVYGGGLGDNTHAAAVNGLVTVNIGACTPNSADPDQGDHTGNSYSGSATIQGNVYGCNNTNGSPQQNVTVNIYQTAHPDGTGFDDTGYALANVFGGGNNADFRVDKTATVNVFGCDNTIRRTFGGGNAAATNSVVTDIKGGRIQDVFGGGNGEVSAADIYGTITLGIHGGNIGQSYSISNQNGIVTGGASVVIDNAGCGGVDVEEHFMGGNFANVYGDLNSEITCEGGMIVKNLYGGCKQAHVLKYPSVADVVVHHDDDTYPDYVIALYDANPATYGSTYAGTGGNVHLTVKGGEYQNVYGGSQGTESVGANIEGNVQLDIYGGTITNAIYGGSHIKGSIGGTIVVNVEDLYSDDACALNVSLANVYGGGNQADYEAPFVSGTSGPHQNYPQVNIKNAMVNNVFGGALNAEVTGNPQIQLKNKATILGNVYGGGNMGVVNGNPKVILNGKQTN